MVAPSSLAFTPVSSLGETPTKWMLFLHGILGTRNNWRGIARRLVAAHPAWGVLLVDLRNHGQSRGFPPPHDLAQTARDLEALDALVGAPIEGVLGHSFGGKVALTYARGRGGALRHVISVDSTPSARPDARGSESTLRVIEYLAAQPKRFAAREEFVAAMIAGGFTNELAMWLAMNLERVPPGGEGGFHLPLDFEAIRSMLDDYFMKDVWDVVEHRPAGRQVRLIVGARSQVFDAEDLSRARRAAAASGGSVHLDVVEGAGHWVHADAPDALVGILVAALAEGPRILE